MAHWIAKVADLCSKQSVVHKPAYTVPCALQCSASCGYGIQSRAVSCMGPPKPEPLSPLFCMHMPKPITIRGCDTGSCRDVALNKTTQTLKANSTEKALPSPPPVHKDASRRRMGSLPPRPTETMAIKEATTATPTPKPNACGLLLLEESGTVDLHNAPSRCTVSVGRPLDEVISITLISSSLDCRKREYVAFFDRLAFVRKCVQAAGSELTTRTNVLLVRQSLVTPGNGVVFTYRSKKNTKRSHHQDCDIQLFSPSGIFENPVTSNTSRTCRVLINAPPSVEIRIQALHIALPFNTTSAQSTYIMIRDMDVLKTNVFNGQQLFLWHSSGNMAEVEFHGDYLYSQGTFRAEYSFVRL